MTARLEGRHYWDMKRDNEGHRDYAVKFLVITDSFLDGPWNVLLCPGLPLPGSIWAYGNDVDEWATCKLDAKVTVHEEKAGDPSKHWMTEFKFSTKPDGKRCKDQQIEDPLLQPADISGSSHKEKYQATKDVDGLPIVNVAHEPIKDHSSEFDRSVSMVKIRQNVATPYQGYVLPTDMLDTVNDSPMWGFPARCIKLASCPWEKKFWGQCNEYYSRTLEFELRPPDPDGVAGFDRTILEEGNKVLNGYWHPTTGAWILKNINGLPPDKDNPQHFMRAVDRQNNVCRMVLTSGGVPSGVVVKLGTGSGTGTIDDPGKHVIQYYQESNFNLLGIPTDF